MAAPTDVSVVPLRVPRGMAPRGRIEAAADPDDVIERTDVDAALDVYDLCIGCRGLEMDPGAPEGDRVAEAAVANAQLMASLALQYVEASHVALRDRAAAFESRVAEAYAKLEALKRKRTKREHRRNELRQEMDATDVQIEALERLKRELEADLAGDGDRDASLGVRAARAAGDARGRPSRRGESDVSSSDTDQRRVRVVYGAPGGGGVRTYGRSAYASGTGGQVVVLGGPGGSRDGWGAAGRYGVSVEDSATEGQTGDEEDEEGEDQDGRGGAAAAARSGRGDPLSHAGSRMTSPSSSRAGSTGGGRGGRTTDPGRPVRDDDGARVSAVSAVGDGGPDPGVTLRAAAGERVRPPAGPPPAGSQLPGLRPPAAPGAHVGGRPDDPLLVRSHSAEEVADDAEEDRGRM